MRERGAVAVGPPDDGERLAKRRAQLDDLSRELDLGRAPDEMDVQPRAELGEELAAGRVGRRVEGHDMVEPGRDAVGVGGGVLGELDPAGAEPLGPKDAAEHAGAAQRRRRRG